VACRYGGRSGDNDDRHEVAGEKRSATRGAAVVDQDCGGRSKSIMAIVTGDEVFTGKITRGTGSSNPPPSSGESSELLTTSTEQSDRCRRSVLRSKFITFRKARFDMDYERDFTDSMHPSPQATTASPRSLRLTLTRHLTCSLPIPALNDPILQLGAW
jgi:hypothetical protein